MPNASYFLFSVPAGNINFTTGSQTIRNYQKDNIEEQVWTARADEATIKVKAGYVYYFRMRMVPYSTSLDHMPDQEGANLIDTYKLTLIK